MPQAAGATPRPSVSARPRPGRSWPPPRSPAARTNLWHAALSLWLNAQQGARRGRRPGRHTSARVLHEVYLHCINARDDLVSQRVENALCHRPEPLLSITIRESERLYAPSPPPPILSAYLHRAATASGSAVAVAWLR